MHIFALLYPIIRDYQNNHKTAMQLEWVPTFLSDIYRIGKDFHMH